MSLRPSILVALLALAGCGPRTVVLVSVGGVEPGTDALVARVDLDGKPAMQTLRIAHDFDRFSVELPGGAAGRLGIEVESLAAAHVTKRGRMSVEVPGPGVLRGAVDLARPRVPAATAWHTFLGGPGEDQVGGVVPAPDGGIFVVGDSQLAWGTPLRAFSGGNRDAFVARLDANGAIVWLTFLGGPGFDSGDVIVRGPGGELYVGGYSFKSWGKPLVAHDGNGLEDSWIARVEPDGTLVWHTFLGGAGQDFTSALAVDAAGDLFVAGRTFGADWGTPIEGIHGGTNDIFLAALSPFGDVRWTTFVGGAAGEKPDALLVDGAGDLVLGGSSDWTFGAPIRPFAEDGYLDGFVATFSRAGAPGWITFLGGRVGDVVTGLALSDDGAITATGSSNSTWANPVRPFLSKTNAALVARLDASGQLRWNTFLGGASESGTAVVLDGRDAIVAGTSTARWPESGSIPKPGGTDAFLARLEENGALLDHAFFGGPGEELDVMMARTPRGELFIAGDTNATWGTPVRAFTADRDIFVILNR